MISLEYLSFLKYPSMGSFRSEPETTKHTIRKSYDKYSYAVSHMCGNLSLSSGWRLYMEDAHIAIAPFTAKKLGLFAVFDGHGGTLSTYLGA